MNAQIEMERGRHAHRTEIRRAMGSGFHLMHLRQVRDFSQVSDASRVNDRGPDVVDELLLNELLTIEDRVEHLADGNRRGRVLADQPESRLQFRGRRIFEPEKMVRLESLAQTRSLDRRQAMMRIVQQLHVGSEVVAQPPEQRRHEVQISIGAPAVFGRQAGLRGFVVQLAAADAVRRLQTGDAALNADGVVTESHVLRHGCERSRDRTRELHRETARRAADTPASEAPFPEYPTARYRRR